ncbi:MAG: hypothetical protein R3Y27_04775 [Clostridia bacterium]
MANVSGAINHLNNSVNNFDHQVGQLVVNVDNATAHIHKTSKTVYDKIQKFQNDIVSGEEVQIAHENIMRIEQSIKEEFENYDAVRKTIMGVVRDFDINLVRNSTIEELSEELWISSSRYWLSYALLAVTAWVSNYKDVAQNAIAESTKKDNVKSSLFFCLLNLRFERIKTARAWFKAYCDTLNPTQLQKETEVMIDAFMNGIFGKDKQLEHEITEIINDWMDKISADNQICQELIVQYENYFNKFNNTAEYEYEFINNFCSQNDQLKQAFINVSKYDSFIKLIDDLNVETPTQTQENYKSRVDAVLTGLITDFDQDELAKKREQAYFKLVIKNKGNIQGAKTQYDEYMKVQNENYNIGKQMVGWVVHGESEKTKPHVRKFGLQNTKYWFQTALENWTIALKESCPLQYDFNIDGWTSTSNARDLEEQKTSMKNYYENNKFSMIYLQGFNIALCIAIVVSLLITVSSIVTCINSGFTPALIVGIVIMIISIVLLVWQINVSKTKYKQRVEKGLYNLECTMAQIIDFQRFFSQNISKKDEVLAKLNFI